MSGGGESNPAGAGLAPLQQKLRRVERDDAWVQLERLPEGGHQIESPVRSAEGFHHTREPLRTTLSGTDFGSCRGLGAETEPFWGPDSCPPQDVVVVLAPSPSGPQDVGELHQSNSATRAPGRAGHADPRPRSRPANRERTERRHRPSLAPQHCTRGEPYDSCLWVGRGITLCICGG